MEAFAQYLPMTGVASHSRPVWVVDRPPGPCDYSCKSGGAGSYFTAASNTWAAGELPPGHTATFTWGVTAVAGGAHTVAWQVSAGLYGKASALIYPSTLESYGLPLLEARAAGLPILTGELDYVRDIVDPEQTFDPRSALSIARAVKRFMGAPQKRPPGETAERFLERLMAE